MDKFTKTETVGWGTRLRDAVVGTLVGLGLFFGAFPLLFWNEGRAVRRAQDLEEGRGSVQEAAAATVEPGQEGRLVHVSGRATTSATVADAQLGPSANALRLRRVVEMYQWVEQQRTETSSNTGGSQTRRTTYSYSEEWRDAPVDSSRFAVPGHSNPPMPVESTTVDAAAITLEQRSLTPALVAQIDRFEALPVLAANVPALAAFGRVSDAAGVVYVGPDPATPAIGDLRVRWEIAPAQDVTILAAQAGSSFADWRTPSGRTLEQNLEVGVVSADAMFTSLEESNTIVTWMLRLLGWLAMLAGVFLLTRPFVVFADVLPFAGTIVGWGAGLIALLVSAPLSLLTIAIGWIAYRPLLGVALVVASVGVAGGVGWVARNRARRRAAA